MVKKMNKEVVTYDTEGKEHTTVIEEDCCSVCNENLYYSADVTKRIAILGDEETEVVGWICPECYSQFDMDDNIQVLFSKNNIQGKT